MAGGLTGTGVYVSYTDWTRFRRMMTRYANGNILPPMAENTYETIYFQRPELEQVDGLPHTVTNNCNTVFNINILLTMHVNVVISGQLDEHLLFWQHTVSITLYLIALYLVWFLRWK